MVLPGEVTANTIFVAKGMPELGLDRSPAALELPFIIYCLQCAGGRFYVGIARKELAKDRLTKHFQGTACHYTQAYPAKDILLVQPAASEAAEAYLYFCYGGHERESVCQRLRRSQCDTQRIINK